MPCDNGRPGFFLAGHMISEMRSYYSSLIDRLILAAVAALLILTPMAFGSVHVWAYSLVTVSVFILIVIWFIDHVALRSSKHLTLVRTPADLALVLLLLVIGLQMVPLPSFLVALLSPQTYAHKKEAFDILAAAGGSSAKQNWMTISYYLHPTRLEGLKVVSYLGIFFLVVQTVRTKKQINFLIYVLILTGSFEALYGTFQSLGQNPYVWWWPGQKAGVVYASGTFIGSNHFAFYLELVLPLTVGFTLAQYSGKQRLRTGLGGARAFIQKVVDLVYPESANPKRFLMGICVLLMGIALVLSASRSGILSLSVSASCMAVLFLGRRRLRKWGMAVCLLLVSIFLLALFLGMTPTVDKFHDIDELWRRLYTTKTLVPILMDYPLLGVGWGNLKQIYPRYIPLDAPENFNGLTAAGYAHNDWIEAVTEIGIIGGLVILLVFSIFGYRMLRIWRRRHDRYALGVGAGVMVGLGAAAVHSFFDFSLRIPANPVALATVAGVGYAATHLRSHGYMEKLIYRKSTVSLDVKKRMVILGAVMFFCLLCSFFMIRHLKAENICPSEWNSTIEINRNPPQAYIQEAMDYNPDNFEYPYEMALYYASPHIQKEMDFSEANEAIVQYLEKTARLNPVSWKVWFRLGGRYVYREYDAYNYINRWLPLAERCFEMAMRLNPRNSGMFTYIGRYWLWRSSIPASHGTKGDSPAPTVRQLGEPARKKFQAIFRHVLRLDPQVWKKVVDEIWSYYPDDAVVMGSLPYDDEMLKRKVIKYIGAKP